MTQGRHQAFFQETVSLPQFRIRDSCNTTRPGCGVAGLLVPISANVLFVKRPDHRRGPGGGVNAICYRSDGHIAHAALWPHSLPQLAGDFAVLPADPVRRTAHAQRQRRQTKTFARIAVHSTKPEKLFARESERSFVPTAKALINQFRAE